LRCGAAAVGQEGRCCWLKRWRRLGVIARVQAL
jgi:hypothetical protein